MGHAWKRNFSSLFLSHPFSLSSVSSDHARNNIREVREAPEVTFGRAIGFIALTVLPSMQVTVSAFSLKAFIWSFASWLSEALEMQINALRVCYSVVLLLVLC